MSIFSERLRALRTEKEELQADIANKLGIKPQSYSAYENGREPNYDLLIKIAEYFDCTIDYLLGISSIRNEAVKRHNDEVIQKFATLNKNLNSPLVIEQFAYSLEAAAALARDLEAFNKNHINPLENYIIIVAELYHMFKLFYEYAEDTSDENITEGELIEGYIIFVKSLSSHKDNISSLAGELSNYFLDIIRALSLRTNEAHINQIKDIEKQLKESENNAET